MSQKHSFVHIFDIFLGSGSLPKHAGKTTTFSVSSQINPTELSKLNALCLFLFQGCFFVRVENNHRTQLSHVFLGPTWKGSVSMFGQRFRSKTNKAQLSSIGPDSGSNLNTYFQDIEPSPWLNKLCVRVHTFVFHEIYYLSTHTHTHLFGFGHSVVLSLIQMPKHNMLPKDNV